MKIQDKVLKELENYEIVDNGELGICKNDANLVISLTLAEVKKIIDDIATPTFDINTKELKSHILCAEELKQKLTQNRGKVKK